MDYRYEGSYSTREQEQRELSGLRVQRAVDAVDEHWPEIQAAAAYVQDCHKALINVGIPQGVAYSLIPAMIEVLGRNK
jgi:hypothetical protein